MSRMNPNELTVLNDRKFEELCAVLGVKQQCVLDPDRKVIEKAFRRNALKCHPDKGGDPVVFKKLNDAYLKLIGHIQKLEQKVEEVELNNSILIEISKTAVSKWQEKLKTRYGWFKSDNCKHLIFDGPYKQYMGRSKMTGNLTLVLYEDPEDGIPKIHVRSSRYMAWIAEMMLPSHLHVEKNKAIQFDQWRMANLAEFGIYFFSDTPKTPMPDRKNGPITPAAAKKPSKREMRKREREANAAKEKEKEQSEGTSAEPCKDENNNSNQTFNACDDQPKHSKTNGSHSEEENVSKESKFQCDLCSEQFQTLMEKNLHKKICFPQSDFLSSGMEDIIDSEFRKNGEKKSPAFICEFCDQKFTNMVWHTKHLNSCVVKIEKEREKEETLYSKEEDENLSADAENKERERLEVEKRQKEKLEAKKKHREKLEAQRKENERLEAEKKKKEVEEHEAERLKKEAEIFEAEKKQKEAEIIEAEKKRKEKERLEAETKRKEAERTEAETRRKEAERIEAEAKIKDAERIEAEAKIKEAKRLEAEKKKIEAERLESERLEAEKKRKEADRLEAEKKKVEAERLEAEKKKIEAERLEAEKKRKETERLEAENKRKEADRLEAEKKKIEAEKLKDEQQKIEAERLKAEKKRKEAEYEQKKKESERQEAEKKKIEAERLKAEEKKKESERLEAERKKIDAERLEAEAKRTQAEMKNKEAERLETEYRPKKVESQNQNPGSEGSQISNNAKVQELMQRKEQERVIRENLKKEKEVKVKEKDELRVRIKFEAEQELKKNKSVEVQEKKNILINGKQDSSSFSQDATKNHQKLPLTRDTGARNSEFAFHEKNRRENEMSDSFANKVNADVLDHGNEQDNTLDTAVKANTMSTSVHHNTSSGKLNPDRLGLQSPERDSVFIPHDNIHLRGNNNENIARQFYVVNKSMSPPASKSLANKEVSNKTAVISAASPTVNADLVSSSSVSNKIFRDYASRQEAGSKEKDKTYLDRELETLDKRHAIKLENITESYREAKKIDLDNKDVNVNRPVALGPSRFDSTSGYSRPAFTSQEPAPKRNSSSSSQSRLVTREPEPSPAAPPISSSKSGITKSFTTADLMSPGIRRRFDTNFNAMPEPYKPAIATETTSRFGESRFSQTSNTSSDLGSKRDASISNYGGQRNYSSYSTPQTASISSLQMPASYVCPPLVTTVSTVTAPSSSISSLSSRAWSEGNGLIISPSSQYKDFYNQIQVTKDRYKSDVEKAMSFDRSAIKPPIIRERLPRPDNTHRRVDREATVMKTMEGARRGKSDDLLRSSSYSRY